MTLTRKRLPGFLALLGAACAVLVSATGATAGTVGVVGGGALVAQANVQPLVGPAIAVGPVAPVTLPPTGGGPLTNGVASINVPGIVETRAGSTSTQGALGPSGFATSSAQAATMNVAGGAVKASLLSSTCRVDSAGNATGASSFAGLMVLGVPVTASPPPNTTVALPGVGTLVLNQQTTTVGSGGNRSITVNAVHVHLAGTLGSGDIYVSQSRCTGRI